ncbi:hypothetical protein PV326_000485 [Microctonus aethiopoides]|nr:hypothetical protein PV326_000485 [Microctonus aethiopoides]
MLVVRLGDLNLERNDDAARPVDFAIEKFKIHPNYNSLHKIHDIAVLRLWDDVQINDFIKPICLPIFDELLNENFIRHTAIVIGWGATKWNKKADHLQQEVCRMKETLESGGPLMLQSNNTFYEIGIVSFGNIQCPSLTIPGVYTEINRHLDFIISQLT